MLPRLRLLILVAVAVSAACAPTPALAGNILGGTSRQCPLALSSAPTGAEGTWQIGCSDGFQSTTAATTFDASELTVVRVSGSASSVTLKPENVAKPTEVTAPLALTQVGTLTSSSIKTFSIEGSSGASVEIDRTSFTKMTALRSLTISSVNVSMNGPMELQPSLNELTIQRAGLVDFKVKVVKGASLNITKLDLQYNNLRRLPLAIFASNNLVSCNLQGNELLPLRLSKRKVERLVRLVATKRLVLGSVASFKASCADGESKSVLIGSETVVVCQVPKEEDDDFVEETEEATQIGVTTRGSSAGSSFAEAGQADATVSNSTSRTVTISKSETPSTPVQKSASPQALSWTTVPAAFALAVAMLAL